jgi:hypothetical protein
MQEEGLPVFIAILAAAAIIGVLVFAAVLVGSILGSAA